MTEKLGLDMARQLMDNFNGTVTDYSYDHANRLTDLVNRKSDSSIIAAYYFTLDANGNRTEVLKGEPLSPVLTLSDIDYTYNVQRNRLLTAGAISFSYDDEGQLIDKDGNTYTFDYEHRLTAISAQQSTFSYDGKGNRLEVVRDGVTTRYIYDARGNLLAEADSSNNITKYFIHGAGLMAMVTLSDEIYTYHFDAVGSTIAMTDQSQMLVNAYSYTPFGIITNEVVNVQQPFKFVGQHGVMMESNGLYYMRARYYDPEIGRFISEDPIGFEGGETNLFAYVGNNPILLIDPSGLCDNDKCIKKLMLVTSYNDAGPGSDWSYYKPKTKGDAPGSVGPGTVAVANTNPKPYSYGSKVTVYGAEGTKDYQGYVHDTGAGWDSKHHNVSSDEWIDIWLPDKKAKEWGKQWREVEICQ